MQILFLSILKTSLMASCVVIFILLIKKIFGKHLNVHFHYYIWFLLLLKLIMPFGVESPYSVFNVLKPIQLQDTPTRINDKSQTQPLYQIIMDQEQESNVPYESELLGNNDSDLEFSFNKSLSTIQILSAVWLLGFIIFLLIMVFARIVFAMRLHNNKNYADENILSLRDSIRTSLNIKKEIPIILDNMVNTPAIYSVLYPKLIMPLNIAESFTFDEMNFIFRHELTHYKKKDLMIFTLISIMRAVHWFNPLLWYAFYKMECDCESSCDAYVLEGLNCNEHKHYGMTIIKILTSIPTNKIPMVNLGAGKLNSDIQRRITMISKFKQSKIKTRVTIMFVAIIAMVSVIFFTNPLPETVNAESIKPVEAAKNILDNSLSKNKPQPFPLQEDTITPIFYDEASDRIVVKKTEKIKSAGDVMQVDAYWDKTYKFIVEGISEVKNYQINSPLVKSINVSVIDGSSIVTIMGNETFAFASSEDENNIYFSAKMPKEVFEYIAVLNPGHGGVDSGGKYDDPSIGLSIQEKDLTLSLAQEITSIADHTKDSKLKIYLVRHDDEKIELEDAADFANKIGGVYIGIHYNMSPDRDANGTETYYFDANTEGKRLSEIIQTKLVQGLNTNDRGSNPADLYIIKNVTVPAVDVEVAFMSNSYDLEKILSDNFTENAALSILNGINEYFGITGDFSQIRDGAFKWPVPSQTKISSPYGNRRDPITAEMEFHTGIDIPAPTGSEVIAVADGIVLAVGDTSDQGKVIIIEHDDNLKTIYAHNSEILISEGQYVSEGDLIARSGSTGDTKGSFLYFEVQKNGEAIDPMTLFK